MYKFYVKGKGFIRFDSLEGSVNYTDNFFLSLDAWSIEERDKVLSDFCSGDSVYIYDLKISERDIITSS